ncbi:MAG: aminotransferase class V-fold PLP-dependent enzyme, partial [Erysipelotrichaceae bacterium]|nr:aminotransferase class V-fold PLP-dependent enzyme [Erysipelotrichaceae bacterium]
MYNETRDTVLKFLNADPDIYTCFYVNSTTDGLNKLASALVESEDDLILATRIEHHANDLSWRERCKVIYAEVDEQGRVIYEDIERLLTENEGKVKYVTITAASNVTGYVTDVHRVAKMAHAHGARIIVDGAQIVAHREFSMKGATPDEDIDFFVFSAHKMYS